jgi:hypothetical protein
MIDNYTIQIQNYTGSVGVTEVIPLMDQYCKSYLQLFPMISFIVILFGIIIKIYMERIGYRWLYPYTEILEFMTVFFAVVNIIFLVKLV